MRRTAFFTLLIFLCAPLQAQQITAVSPSRYVTVGSDGHLHLGSERVRFWGVVSFVGGNAGDNSAVALRYKEMGFNLARLWTGEAAWKPYVRGDKSPADLADNLIYALGRQGIHVWATFFNERGTATADDAAILDEPRTSAAWKEAVKDPINLRGMIACAWDRRLEALGIARMKRWADHKNEYTGLRMGDDPTIAIWELTNEEWWFGKMVGGNWQKLPPFFRNELLLQWNNWLLRKYGTTQKITDAWHFLLPGENLEQNTVLLAPLRDAAAPAATLNDANPAANALVHGLAQQYTRDDFARRRGEDVIAFFLELWIAHKQREHDAVKTWGGSCRNTPLVWDTGIGYEIQAQYMQQHADAIAHDTYVTGFHHDPTAKRFPWYSGLEELPRLCWDVPWIEQNRMEGKPYFVYETQIEQPAKYRAEYPLRIAALGSIQDWDAVCWHLFGDVPDSTKQHPYDGWMDVTDAGGHPQGYHFRKDEVQMSAMKAAAELFKNMLVPPAPHPTRFIYGRKSLLDPATMDYGRSYGELGRKMMPTTYRYGMRLLIDPTREEDTVEGETYKPRVYEPNPIQPNRSIEYDWQRGHLKMDAPGVASYTGFFAQYGGAVRFRNGITLHQIQVVNPPKMAYPVTPLEKYVEFTLASTDGLPLFSTHHAILSCVSTSFNDGFALDESKIKNEFGWWLNSGATRSRGGEKPMVARVAATFDCVPLNGMHYILRDWHMQVIGTGIVAGGKFVLPATKPVFCVEFTR